MPVYPGARTSHPSTLRAARIGCEESGLKQQEHLRIAINKLSGVINPRAPHLATQLLHSMYLDEVESCACSTTVAIADARDVVSDLRDFEFKQARI